MTAQIPDVVSRYFELDADRDNDGVTALFTDDATVVDEGETHRGTVEIRAWRIGPASRYRYTTDVTGSEALGADRFLVTGRLTDDFPGGTADLKWDFIVAGDQIARLVIAHEARPRRSRQANLDHVRAIPEQITPLVSRTP
jgi:hypothetical protein